MNVYQKVIVLLTATMLSAANVSAEGLGVKPTKLFFTPGADTSSLTLSNDSDQKISVQMTPMAWSHSQDGVDAYERTSDIVVFPRILQIAPGEERVIRVGYQGHPVGDRERAYRLYAQELPVDEPGVAVMKFVVRIGVPVFARSRAHDIEWRLGGATFSPQGLNVRVENSGGQHVMVDSISARGVDASGAESFSIEDNGWYVHARNGRGFQLPVTPEQCAGASTVELTVSVNEESMTTVMNVDSRDCTILLSESARSRLAH